MDGPGSASRNLRVQAARRALPPTATPMPVRGAPALTLLVTARTISGMVAMAAYVTVLWLIICLGAGFYIWFNNRNHRRRKELEAASSRAGTPSTPGGGGASPPAS